MAISFGNLSRSNLGQKYNTVLQALVTESIVWGGHDEIHTQSPN